MEPLGFDGSMSSPLGSGSAGTLSPRRLLARSGPAPSTAARGGWFWGTAPRGAWAGAAAAGRGLCARAAVEPADPEMGADAAGPRRAAEACGIAAADGAEAAGGIAAFGASTGDPEAGDAPGWLARDARIFPACVLRSPGSEEPDAGGRQRVRWTAPHWRQRAPEERPIWADQMRPEPPLSLRALGRRAGRLGNDVRPDRRERRQYSPPGSQRRSACLPLMPRPRRSPVPVRPEILAYRVVGRSYPVLEQGASFGSDHAEVRPARKGTPYAPAIARVRPPPPE